MRAGAKRSKPAATAVWVVKRLPGSSDGQRDFEGLPGLFHETSGALQHGKGRMPFIQMADLRLDAERMQAAAIRRSRGAAPA